MMDVEGLMPIVFLDVGRTDGRQRTGSGLELSRVTRVCVIAVATYIFQVQCP